MRVASALLLSCTLALAACAGKSLPPAAAHSATPPALTLHGRATTEGAIFAEARAADIVWLGEKHDNPEHHLLQARVLAALVKAGARPAVVFEMIEDDKQSVLDALAARPSATAADYRTALDWDHSSWPAFAMYEPIFEVALHAKLRIVAGNAPGALVKQVAFTGEGAGDLAKLPPDAEHDLEQELDAAHCGMLPADSLPAMALAQRVRDSRLAQHAREAEKTGVPRAVVITGNGHARNDRGGPWEASRAEPTLHQFSISFHEAPADADPNQPYDAVWITSAMPPEDHCKNLKLRGAQR
ncbi:MAG: ChaN family lipoprotein [Polyangiaceae bacterium]